jgi:hypothetical protein
VVNATTHSGDTALHLLLRHQAEHSTDHALSKGKSGSKAVSAVASLAALKALLAAGADVNIANSHGQVCHSAPHRRTQSIIHASPA